MKSESEICLFFHVNDKCVRVVLKQKVKDEEVQLLADAFCHPGRFNCITQLFENRDNFYPTTPGEK